MRTRATFAGLLLCAIAACGTVSASAQDFTKQVNIIVPYAPGGTSDILARLIGPKLSELIGQPVIVENKPSASGNIGADFVAKQAGDGHTLLITDVGTLATQPSLVKKLSFDVQKDLVPVTMVMFSPYLFAVQSVGYRQHVRRADRLQQGQPGQAQRRQQRRRLDPAPDRARGPEEARDRLGPCPLSRRRCRNPRRGGEREQRDLQRRAADHAVRRAEPAQGDRRLRRPAAGQAAEPADLQGDRHADRRDRLVAGIPRPARERRPPWRRG